MQIVEQEIATRPEPGQAPNQRDVERMLDASCGDMRAMTLRLLELKPGQARIVSWVLPIIMAEARRLAALYNPLLGRWFRELCVVKLALSAAEALEGPTCLDAVEAKLLTKALAILVRKTGGQSAFQRPGGPM